jgi:hypothetical protein
LSWIITAWMSFRNDEIHIYNEYGGLRTVFAIVEK